MGATEGGQGEEYHQHEGAEEDKDVENQEHDEEGGEVKVRRCTCAREVT